MLIQSLYNVVDSIFVARLSSDALTAVSLAYPLQNLVLAVAVGYGVGSNAFVARSLGRAISAVWTRPPPWAWCSPAFTRWLFF